MTGNSTQVEKTYRILEGTHEAEEAIEQLVSATRSQLRIFDGSAQSLHSRGFGSPERIEHLRAMLLANRSHAIRIALHSAQGIEGEVPRLMSLMTQFSGQLTIHRTLQQAAEARDVLIIGDDYNYWRKPHIDHPRSILSLNSPTDASPLAERFEEIWAQSELAVTSRALGL